MSRTKSKETWKRLLGRGKSICEGLEELRYGWMGKQLDPESH